MSRTGLRTLESVASWLSSGQLSCDGMNFGDVSRSDGASVGIEVEEAPRHASIPRFDGWRCVFVQSFRVPQLDA